MKPLPMIVMIEPLRYCRDWEIPGGMSTDLPRLFEQAGVELRAETPDRQIIVYHGSKQLRSVSTDAVGVPVRDLMSQEAALRALEALAFSFHDHAVRFSICGRGLFCA